MILILAILLASIHQLLSIRLLGMFSFHSCLGVVASFKGIFTACCFAYPLLTGRGPVMTCEFAFKSCLRLSLVAEWIHFILFGILLPTRKLKVYTFGGLMNSATKLHCP